MRALPLILASVMTAAGMAQELCDPAGSVSERTCVALRPESAPRTKPLPPCTTHEPDRDERIAELEKKHRLDGNACYYSSFFHGRKTANGEIYRNDRFSAAHLTLPLGTLVEVESLSTGKKLKLRVNDRGPYTGNFIIDLSRAAAKEIGVDKAVDRRVQVRVLALPGEKFDELIEEAATLEE